MFFVVFFFCFFVCFTSQTLPRTRAAPALEPRTGCLDGPPSLTFFVRSLARYFFPFLFRLGAEGEAAGRAGRTLLARSGRASERRKNPGGHASRRGRVARSTLAPEQEQRRRLFAQRSSCRARARTSLFHACLVEAREQTELASVCPAKAFFAADCVSGGT